MKNAGGTMESAKSALASTKRTHAAIKKHEDDGTSPDSQELREWRTVAAAANKDGDASPRLAEGRAGRASLAEL
eukprot:3021111-Prymnesium_polylepis.2